MKKLLSIIFLLGVALSPAYADEAVNGYITAAGTTCTTDVCIDHALPPGTSAVSISVEGTYVGTLQFEVSSDGSHWYSADAYPVPFDTGVSNTTSTGLWVVQSGGLSNIRVRCSAYTSGGAAVVLRSGEGPFVNTAALTVEGGDASAANQATMITSLEIIDDPVTTVSSTDLIRVGIWNDSDTQVTTFGGGYQYDEDAVHSTGDTGTLALVVRQDAAAQLADTDGDNSALINDANGRLHVLDQNSAAILAYTDAIKTAVELLDNAISGSELQVDIVSGGTGSTQYAEDAVHVSGNTGTMNLTVRQDANSALAADGDYAPFQTDGDGNLKISIENDDAGIGGGTQYADGDAAATPTGTVMMVDDGTNVQSAVGDSDGHPFFNLWGYGGSAVGTDNAIHVQPGSGAEFSVTGTFWQSTQPVSAESLPLPTGASTSANQSTANGHLNTLSGTDFMLGTDFSDVLGTDSLILGTQADSLANTSDGLQTSGMLYLFNDSTWDRARGDSTDGMLVNLGSNNDVTQSGNWNMRLQDGSGNAITSAARGSERAASVQIIDASGNQITSFGGSGGTSETDDGGFTLGTDLGTPMMGVYATDNVDAGEVGVLAMTQDRHLLVEDQNAAQVGTDDSAFTFESDDVLPTGFAYDTTPDQIDDGDIGIGRMSDYRVQLFHLWDAAGNERGANINASYELQTRDDDLNADLDTLVALILSTQADDVANTEDGLQASSFGMYFDGSTWDRMRGNSTDGMLVNLGSNNDISGTVTANAGTNLNTSALALETSVDGIEGLLNGGLPAALGAQGGMKIEGVASGTPVPVSGTFWQSTQPVSVASLPLPTSAATDAKLDDIIADTDAIETATEANQTVLEAIVANNPCMTDARTVVAINQAASAELIAAVGGDKIYVCGGMLATDADETVQFAQGTGSVCATSQGSRLLTGVISLPDDGNGFLIQGLQTNTAGEALCILQGGSEDVDGWISYVQK